MALISMTMPLATSCSSQKRVQPPNFKPLSLVNKPLKAVFVKHKIKIQASMAIPEAAEAAGNGVSPSLKNFLLSIVAGGLCLEPFLGLLLLFPTLIQSREAKHFCMKFL